MFKLLKSEDKSVLNNSNFVKNAVLYKDMLCFYEAYRLIMKNKNNLPNFCYAKKKEVCLEGICLLIKMYATEFRFETLKLSLDYLKILYYTIASYAESDKVERDVIIEEFDDYRDVSIKYCNTQKEELEAKQKQVSDVNKEIKNGTIKSQKMKRNGRCASVFSIVLLILSVLSISMPVLGMNFKPDNKLLFWGSIVATIIGFMVTIVLKIVGKRLLNSSSDLTFHIQNLKKNNEINTQELLQLQSKYYKVFCEKYEYKTCFSDVFSRYTKVLTINEILAKAKKYKILSYNLAYDIGRLFKSQQKEISEIVSDIDGIVFSGDYKKQFSTIYSQICEQDWLYYNAEIRLHFLKKFTDISEREYDWKLDIDGRRVNPFEVNIRELSRELVAFSSETYKKKIPTHFSDFVKTKYFKNLEQLNFKNGYTIDEFRKVKASYLKHFCRIDVLKKLSNVFYDQRDNTKIKDVEFPMDEVESVPTLVRLKLKIIENLTGLGNSDANVIKSIAQTLFNDESKNFVETANLSENDIDYPKFTAEKLEEFDEYFVYEVNGQKKIGYKID